MVTMCAGELTVTHSESREDRELPQHSSSDLRQSVHVIHKDNENVRRDYIDGAGSKLNQRERMSSLSLQMTCTNQKITS
jgi:hypothetical protein